ncbi:MOSC domain-containing protein [Conexibacter sp. SYSU D00693]|uniref:MOSC domain-containing protein n=1 Tax=Conexibacter sp. SYSU D00693 TaxID=2812560 RepID=UPI00196A51EC|nr:MOSC domain-containing protein [Conexibacter sp. SYSU D00693]
MGRVESVNVGRAAQIGVRRGRPVMSGIGKAPVTGRVAVGPEGLEGDQQADRRVHGGPDKAVYAYAAEDLAAWAHGLDRPLAPGAFFGENLTTSGLDLAQARIGDRWAVGSTLLEVCQPRIPCFKLGLRFEDPKMLKRFAQVRLPGAYLRVLETGDVGAGDAVQVVERPDHEVTIALLFEGMLHDHALLQQAVAAPALPEPLRAWILSEAA